MSIGMDFKGIWMVCLGAVILVALGIGVKNYILACKGVTTVPSKDDRTKKIVPLPLLAMGVLLAVLPFLMRILLPGLGARLLESIPIVSDQSSGGDLAFAQVIWLANTVFAVILLLVTFYKRCRKRGWGFIKIMLVFVFTYYQVMGLLGSALFLISDSLIGSADLAILFYGLLIYVYLFIWTMVVYSKEKQTA